MTDLLKNFSTEFLSMRQFSAPFETFKRGDDLVKVPAHHKYNSPPFDFLGETPLRPAFHLAGSGVFVVDVDKCFYRDGRQLRMKPWSVKFLLKYKELTAHEFSVSGNGAHFYIKALGELNELRGLHSWKTREGAGGVELYIDMKWVAVTGKPLFNNPHPQMLELDADGIRALMAEIEDIFPVTRSVSAKHDFNPESCSLATMDTGFDIDTFLNWLGIPIRQVEASAGVTYHRLEYCPFENHSNGSGANAAITFGTTLGFICHDSDCSSKKISDVVRWAWDKTRRSCPCPIWLDEGDLWEIEQHKVAREAGIVLQGGYR